MILDSSRVIDHAVVAAALPQASGRASAAARVVLEGAADEGAEHGGLRAPGRQVLAGEVASLVDRAGDDQRLAAQAAQCRLDDRAGLQERQGKLAEVDPLRVLGASARVGPGAAARTSLVLPRPPTGPNWAAPGWIPGSSSRPGPSGRSSRGTWPGHFTASSAPTGCAPSACTMSGTPPRRCSRT